MSLTSVGPMLARHATPRPPSTFRLRSVTNRLLSDHRWSANRPRDERAFGADNEADLSRTARHFRSTDRVVDSARRPRLTTGNTTARRRRALSRAR